VVINYESCICAFLLTTLLPYLPCYYPLHIILFWHLLSTNHKCTQPSIPPVVQTYYSEGEDGYEEFVDEEFYAMYALPRLLFLWCYGVFRCSVSEESRFSV
jgi:hypothetical protein